MPSSLDRIFSSATSTTPSASTSNSSPHSPTDDPIVRTLPNGYVRLASGVVLDPSGKPCRQCTSNSAWMDMMKRSSTKTSSTSSNSTVPASAALASATSSTSPALASQSASHTSTDFDLPPDVDSLGRATWTLLHSVAATYPPKASPSMQATTRSFIETFSKIYPCGYCAEDFRGWMREPGNEVRTEGRDALGDWACRAHNAVNVKLGKETFDCSLWKRRWGADEE